MCPEPRQCCYRAYSKPTLRECQSASQCEFLRDRSRASPRVRGSDSRRRSPSSTALAGAGGTGGGVGGRPDRRGRRTTLTGSRRTRPGVKVKCLQIVLSVCRVFLAALFLTRSELDLCNAPCYAPASHVIATRKWPERFLEPSFFNRQDAVFQAGGVAGRPVSLDREARRMPVQFRCAHCPDCARQ